MLTLGFAHQFARDWIAAWNAHDLERILEHYTDDFELSSPFIARRMAIASGTLRGKDAVRPYWELALSRQPPLRFELEDVRVGAFSLIISYNRHDGRRGAEAFFFNDRQQVYLAAAHYDTEP